MNCFLLLLTGLLFQAEDEEGPRLQIRRVRSGMRVLLKAQFPDGALVVFNMNRYEERFNGKRIDPAPARETIQRYGESLVKAGTLRRKVEFDNVRKLRDGLVRQRTRRVKYSLAKT